MATTVASTSIPDDCHGTPKIAGLIEAIQKYRPVQTMQAHLQGLVPHEKVLCVVDILNVGQQQVPILESVKVSTIQLLAFLDPSTGAGQHVTENGTPQVPCDPALLAILPLILPATPSLSVHQLERSIAEASPVPCSSSSLTPLPRQREILVAGQQVAMPILIPDDDVLTAHEPMVPAMVELPRQSPFLEDICRSETSSASRLVTSRLPSPSPCPVGSPPCGPLLPEQTVNSPAIAASQPCSADPAVDQFPSPADSRAQAPPQSQSFPGLDHTLPPITHSMPGVVGSAPTVQSSLVSRDEAVTSSFHSDYPGRHLLSSPLHSAAPTAIARLAAIPTSHNPLSLDTAGLSYLSTGLLLHPSGPTLMQPVAGSAGPPLNMLSSTAQPPASKRRRITSLSSHIRSAERYFFKLQDDWVDNSRVSTALSEQGFYKTSDVPMFANGGCPAAIINELTIYCHTIDGPPDGRRLHNCLHSLVQQALVQNPHVYLMALAAMRTTNHLLISLPVPLIMFPGSGQCKFMDPTFPFVKFIEGKDEVPTTRILYSLGDARLRIGTSLPSKKEVKAWWDKYNGDLTGAGTLLPDEQFSTAQLFAGEFLAMRPQLIWYAEGNSSMPAHSTFAAQPIKFVKVRYVSVTQGKDLDFHYCLDRTYDEISQFLL
ncbi:hypothetical protein L873DRAFT_1849181 [Choiromyces venosus 120613-1]|uniref:Uncharacterized protein n=1 Tax=Choiromyces venosus 120613-1 TaxID=1336337 RepID=A0A3N4J797_9PEZI|nr:hypothetical protein L873DRAFT_1849181 [Choiromyces venosus 120613-1]